MKKYSSIVLSIFILGATMVGMVYWSSQFYQTSKNYRSPLRDAILSAQPDTPAQLNKVVLVIVSGLGYDNALTLDMPTLNQLRQTGANAAIFSPPPTYSQTAWASLISGATAELNDAPPFDLPLTELQMLATDTIFVRAHEARRQTALFGEAAWRHLLPRNHLDHTFYVESGGSEADELLLEAALPIIRDKQTNLIVLQFTQLDRIASQQGLASPAYQQATQELDALLAEIVSATDLNSSVLAIVGDHGHLAAGGFGGNEVEVVWQPLLFAGKNVIPGEYSDIFQMDVAPTISALLGVAPPTAAQGRILFEMFRFTEQDQALAQLSLSQQRMELATAYTAQLNGQEETPPLLLPNELSSAQAALSNNNISGAFQLALLTQDEADQLLQSSRQQLLRTDQLTRLSLAVLIIIVWSMVIWRRRGEHAGSIIVATVITIALYHSLYQLQGFSYSLSTLPDFAELPFMIAQRVAISLLVGGGILLVLLILTGEDTWTTLLGSVYGFTVLVTFIFVLLFLWGFWQNGLWPIFYLPDVSAIFWQATGALESIAAAALGLIIPWPIAIFSYIVGFIRRRLNETKPRRRGSDALSGLHL